VYVTLAVLTLGDSLTDVAVLGIRKRIRQRKYGVRMQDLLLREAAAAGTPHFMMTEAGFLMEVLLEHDLVDEETLISIRHQFKHMIRHAKWRPQDPKQYTAKIIFCEQVAAGLVKQREPATFRKRKQTTGFAMVDLTARDGGYKEWFENYWSTQARV